MERLTFIAALIGCIGTIANWIFFFWNKRTSIKFDIHKFSANNRGVLLFGTLTNRSDSNISIGDIALLTKNEKLYLQKIRTEVVTITHRRNGVKISEDREYNLPFPVNLYPYSGQSGYFLFEALSQTPLAFDKDLNFEIYTNRKQKISVSIPLDQVLPSNKC